MSSNPVFARLGTTIFTAMSALSVRHQAINLGQGFPDLDGPESVRAEAARVLMEGPNQYPLMRGVPELRRALSEHARRYYGLNYDPETEMVVTSGATEALADAIFALLAPGDEILLIEPHYDAYRPLAEAAGAVVKTIALAPPDWRLTAEALTAAITPRTRAVLVNTPVNPIGRVFDESEMRALAQALENSDALAICDEVYEHLCFDGRRHIPLASLPGMRERVVRIGSAGKIFSLTGWKVGWVMGPKALMDVIANAHQFITFTTPPAQQLGVAHGLADEMAFPRALCERLQGNRDALAKGLTRIGFGVLPSEGTYFLTARIDALLKEEDGANEKDRAFCERMVREAGVTAIPLSSFFAAGRPDIYVRFAFCKERSVIDEAIARLKMYFQHG
ncbi:MAG TPA: aminotransferase [Rhizomicrobium sp.]|jgi:N-succinyldiaminopimelate aminotransferase|nr:aminotransferase [Rhizomicrobium sp.]